MYLNYHLPAKGFEVCIYKIKLCGRHTLCGMPMRVDASSRPRVNDIIGLVVLAMAEHLIIRAAMHLKYYLPAWGFKICTQNNAYASGRRGGGVRWGP